MYVYINFIDIYIKILFCDDHKQVYGTIAYGINKLVGTTCSWFLYTTNRNAKKIIDYTQDPKPQALITPNIVQV